MTCRWLIALWALVWASSALAGETAPALGVGDCVLFREGGDGLVLKAPTYWVRGSVAEVSREHRLAGRCPQLGKPMTAYRHDDWVRWAAAMPCVDNDAEVREVTVLRVRMAVDEWETPWSLQHGTVGWLFRGQFLDQPLKKGGLIEVDAQWLERCESQS